jgi:hypothetical protein
VRCEDDKAECNLCLRQKDQIRQRISRIFSLVNQGLIDIRKDTSVRLIKCYAVSCLETTDIIDAKGRKGN